MQPFGCAFRFCLGHRLCGDLRLRHRGSRVSAIEQRASGNPEFGGSGARYIYVQASDLDRARAVLDVQEAPFSDEELAQLSEQAAREARE